jgi:hypothetical protein
LYWVVSCSNQTLHVAAETFRAQAGRINSGPVARSATRKPRQLIRQPGLQLQLSISGGVPNVLLSFLLRLLRNSKVTGWFSVYRGLTIPVAQGTRLTRGCPDREAMLRGAGSSVHQGIGDHDSVEVRVVKQRKAS